jgi:ribonuclease E
MSQRMLIDAAHPEEIRVAVLKGNRLEDFDFETATKKQLKGNIYLAKVTRVEPSLQAAFVDYGGNRHGFLAFNEIHPDYYRIPVADREALLAQEKALAERGSEGGDGAERTEGEELETIGGDDEEVAPRRIRPPRPYKIQEVTKRRQIMLVQVVKEERGNKGAALTTYLSLAGRYCVLMPNTPRGGGISRKITSPKDRRRLKSILEEFEMPDGMSVIVRTAGMERSKAEIKRDLEYLMRLWDEIRTVTLKSTAPTLIYEEANLIKRAIRDLYDRDIDEIQVEGDEGYRAAKEFMRMLTPSHAKRVHQYKDDLIPLFHRYQVEGQIDAIHSPVVQLKSGGYIVIMPTEALVSIDVNSGRATKERNIEETALRTNLEAAEEIARQLRLRDLAGLIVIDFIDMEEPRNNAAVERRLKEAMRVDRARIQIGRISPFGLLELSRQRLRPSLVEATMQHCTHCGGSGWVRSVESAALHTLRGLEEEGIRQRSAELKLTAPPAVALYLLNQKRTSLAEIERRYRFAVAVDIDETLIPPAFRLDRIKATDTGEQVAAPVSPESVASAPLTAEAVEAVEAVAAAPAEPIAEAEAPAVPPALEDRRAAEADGEGQRRWRRRRRRRRRGGEEGAVVMPATALPGPPLQEPGVHSALAVSEPGAAPGVETAPSAPPEPRQAAPASNEGERPRRARGRRGGRRRRRGGGERPPGEIPAGAEVSHAGAFEAAPSAMATPPPEPAGGEPATDSSAPAEEDHALPSSMLPEAAPAAAEVAEADGPRPRRPRRHEDREEGAVTETARAVAAEALPTAREADARQPLGPPPPSEESGGAPETAGTQASAGTTPSREPAPGPSTPVITVGGSEDRRPKKRGWWQRFTD